MFVSQGSRMCYRMPTLVRLNGHFSTPAQFATWEWSHVGVHEPRGGVKLYDHLIDFPVAVRTLSGSAASAEHEGASANQRREIACLRRDTGRLRRWKP
jgi:hypothetical protein